MPVKINLKSAAEAGIINAYKTDDAKTFVLVIKEASKDAFVIPCIDGIAYIDTSTPTATYVMLQNLISDIAKMKMFTGLTEVTPIKEAAPEHTKNIKGFIKPAFGNKGREADQALIDAGYVLPSKESITSAVVERNYSKLMKENPEAAEIYKENHEMLLKAGATYESLSPEIKIAHEGILAGSALGIIFEGPTGTGKSWAARILADHDKAPLLNLQITYGTTIEDLVGQFIPNDDPASDAKWKFVMGPLLRAYTEGWPIVIEEVNYGQPGVNAKLNEFTDGTMRVTVNGKSYKKHPNFVCYMTMNPGYEGTEVLNVALKNRFAKVSVPALSKDEYVKRLIDYSASLGHALSEDFFSKLFDFDKFIEKEAATSKWHENVKFSVRNAQRVCDCILQKTRSEKEFADAIAVQYLNDLSTDNDNSENLEALKKNKDIQRKITEIYELYDFAEMKDVVVSKSLEDCVEEEYSEEHKESKDKMVDDLFSHFKE